MLFLNQRQLMARKRISSKAAGDIASKRISALFRLSRESVTDGNDERAKRYVSLARRIGQRTRTPMPDDERYCKSCGLPLIAGRNCRVRIGGGRVRMTCLICGNTRRMPYIKEQIK